MLEIIQPSDKEELWWGDEKIVVVGWLGEGDARVVEIGW